jgi:hypothetical protein
MRTAASRADFFPDRRRSFPRITQVLTPGVGDCLALSAQLFSSHEITGDLLGCTTDLVHGGDLGQAWPDEVFHSPWTWFFGIMSS